MKFAFSFSLFFTFREEASFIKTNQENTAVALEKQSEPSGIKIELIIKPKDSSIRFWLKL